MLLDTYVGGVTAYLCAARQPQTDANWQTTTNLHGKCGLTLARDSVKQRHGLPALRGVELPRFSIHARRVV